jgi:protein-S-isoprenylcysteine O-methyltransferase Ste14
MKSFGALAALVLFFQLPIPLFWLILHPRIDFWRRHLRAGYWTAGLSAWGATAVFLIAFRGELFASERAPLWAIAAGLLLLGVDVWLFRGVGRDLGHARLIGLAELHGAGELATQGLYARMRHPRYTGMMLSMFGACLLAWRRALAGVALVWLVLALTAIALEERELRARFGAAYLDYCKRVPRFLPFRLRWPEP